MDDRKCLVIVWCLTTLGLVLGAATAGVVLGLTRSYCSAFVWSGGVLSLFLVAASAVVAVHLIRE